MKNDNEILVSIHCLTYNHAPYIRECLDGFVMQKTNFPFEIVIHDDASTDGTADIIREYEKKYPHLFNAIYETENQYAKYNGSFYEVLSSMQKAMRGKYIAYCEGDDYWIDPYKLQKQVDFLENHLDYTMCFHKALVHHETDSSKDYETKVTTRDYSGQEILTHIYATTASVLIRRGIYDTELYKKVLKERKFFGGDASLFLTCAHYGKVRGMDECMSVYRRECGGVTGSIDYRKLADEALAYEETFGIGYHKESERFFHSGCWYAYIQLKAKGNKKEAETYLHKSFKRSFWGALRPIFKYYRRAIIRRTERYTKTNR